MNIQAEDMNHSEILKKMLIEQDGSRLYSGRGMYGKQCVGISTNNAVKFLTEFFAYITKSIDSYFDQFDENNSILEEINVEQQKLELVFHLANELNNTEIQTDSLGMGQIIYFPNIEAERNDF